MVVILDRIDNTLRGDVCPCGADPRPGSPYCSYDCEPNITGEHTDLSPAGSHAYATPMRWRPDLATEARDDGLTSLGGRVRSGRFWREVFERDGFDGLHLRLDDGHRFVGTDVSAEFGHDADNEAWRRLERELANPRYAIPDVQSTAAVGRQPEWQALADRLRAGTPTEADRERLADTTRHINAVFAELGRQLRPLAEAFADASRQLAAQVGAVATHASPGREVVPDARERALAHIRNRNTGPQARQRAPQSINPRRSR